MEHSQCLRGPVEVTMVMPFSCGGDRQEGQVLLCPHSSTAVRVCACGGGASGGQEGPDIWPPNKQPTASRKRVLKGFIPTLSCSAPIYGTLPFSEYGHRFALRPGVLMRIQLLLVTLRIP